MMKRNDGFTLVELIVSIAISTIVTAGVLSILLFGMRINAKTANNVKQQNVTNMLTTIVQDIAEESGIEIITTETGVIAQGKDGAPKIEFIKEEKAVYLNNTKFMDEVKNFTLNYDETSLLLSLTIELDDNGNEEGTKYTIKNYCRLNANPPPTPTPTPTPTPDEGGTADES